MVEAMGQRLDENALAALAGREAEMRVLLQLVRGDASPVVVHVHGVSGIGKSALLKAFALQAKILESTVLELDGRVMEPTERGFLDELGRALGHPVVSVSQVMERLARLTAPVVLALDSFELLGLIDTWLRRRFIPQLPASARVLLAGRLPPGPSWTEAPEWHGLLRTMQLGPLDDDAARRLLASIDVEGRRAEAIVRGAFGHPLVLRLAGMAAAGSAGADEGLPQVALHELAQRVLDDLGEPDLRSVLRAACVARRVTRTLLEALSPGADVDRLFDRLARLPFVEVGRHGLVVHDAIREAIAADLRASDPVALRALRGVIWRQLSAESRGALRADLWRYTADLIHLVDNPVVRDAFFPRDAARYSVERARPIDSEAIRAIAALHEGEPAVDAIRHWWSQAPESFHTVVTGDGTPVGFYCLFDPAAVPREALRADPVARAWCEHLARDPIPKGQRALFLRRLLSRDHGEGPSPVQAAGWLDIKRHYLELRPNLRRVYLGVVDPAPYAEVAARLGFKPVPGATVPMGAASVHSVALDMGPASVDGWLDWLIGTELREPAGVLDHARRALRLDDRLVHLTRREFEVLCYLSQRREAVVSRTELLKEVWGLHFDGGSNVVDALVAGLRRKLGGRAGMIETVRGHGYLYRDPAGG